MKSKSLPEFAFRLRTYRELDEFSRAFANDDLNLLMLFGAPGLGKSQCLRRSLAGRGCYLEGNATPFAIYRAAFEHRGEPLILDDVDGLYRNRAGIRLLKSLCQSQRTKTVNWFSEATSLLHREIPNTFTTNSHVAIVGNEWKSLSPDVKALEDRGHLVFFDPSAIEVHRNAASWFWIQEIFDFIRDVLHLITTPSLRLYVRAAELYSAQLDWKSIVLGQCLTGTALEVAKLKANSAFSSEEARVREFVRRGFGRRATYFNHAARIARPVDDVPHIKLTNQLSPAQREAEKEARAASILEILRRRQMGFGKN